MFKNFKHSIRLNYDLIKGSLRLMRHDPELITFTILTVIPPAIFAFIFFAFLISLAIAGFSDIFSNRPVIQWIAEAIVIFIMFFISHFFATFFMFCAAFTVKIRLNHGNPTFKKALSFSKVHMKQIIIWALLLSVVSTVLTLIFGRKKKDSTQQQPGVNESDSFLGALIKGGWEFVTMFSIPAMVYYNYGIKDSFMLSLRLVKQGWAKYLIGASMMSFLGIILLFTVVPGMILFFFIAIIVTSSFSFVFSSIFLFVLFALWMFVVPYLLVLVFRTLHTIYVISLFNYMVTHEKNEVIANLF